MAMEHARNFCLELPKGIPPANSSAQRPFGAFNGRPDLSVGHPGGVWGSQDLAGGP